MSDTEAFAAFLRAFAALPEGEFTGTYQARRYVAAKTSQAGGASQKLVAEELGGGDYISLNLYHLSGGARLRPCEMSEAKVVDFVLGLKAD